MTSPSKAKGRSPRDAVISNLNRALAGTPMAGQGAILEHVGRLYRLHPAFIAAVAAFEGGFDLDRHTGLRPCLPYNPYGISSCGAAWTAPRFRSWAESIAYAARFLSSRWPRARTAYDYPGFCTCGTAYWGGKVAAKMRQIGYGPSITYGRSTP